PDFARSVSRLPAWPAGSLMLSAPDLWRFGRALADGRLVRRETLEAMMAGGIELRAAQEGRPASRYGLGFGVNGEGMTRTMGHTGGAPGVDAAIRIELATGRTVAVLSNRSGTDALNASLLSRTVLAHPVTEDCGR
ncbi:MAG: serine hydrolase, partial [Hyphomonadaceae bacterium]|nr:serine hydrolase [Hyphomonadaceae bacterium]MBY0422758.1 serine hydrolase [Parvularculaceae bacterium]